MWHKTQVISGKGRGNKIGFPTLNLSIPKNLNQDYGIYAGWIKIDQKKYKGAFHFGPIPTFLENTPVLEVFVLDHFFQDKPNVLSFSLDQKLRDIIKFEDQKSLVKQIKNDVKVTQKLIS